MLDVSKRLTVIIAVVGSREYPKKYEVIAELNTLLKTAISKNRRLHIVSGGADGVDTWAYDWALENQVMITVIPAEWNLFRKPAGYLRNEDIWNMASAGIAFWDGKSPGTQHSFKLAEKQFKTIRIIRSDEIDDLPW